MKKKRLIFMLFGLIIFSFIGASGQSSDDKVLVDKSFLADSAKCFDEAVLCRDAVEKFKVERSRTEAERIAADTLIKALNELVAVKDRIISAQNELILFYEKRLNKPKSTLEKILNGAKEAAKAALYILIGRGLSF
jgi:hypothetical protein